MLLPPEKNLMMSKYCFAILLTVLVATGTKAQEIGIVAGASQYGGDLSKVPFIIEETNLGGSGYYQHYLSDQFSIRGSLSFGKLTGNDLNKQSTFARNLNFENSIVELGAVAAYDFGDASYQDLVPYVYGGLAFFRHNPKADLNGTLVELQPLGTEGQGIPGFGDLYSLSQFSLPVGGGVKMAISDQLKFVADFSAKKTFTDHLDDVSRQQYVPQSTFRDQYAVNDPKRLALLEQLAYRGDELENGLAYSEFENPTVRRDNLRNNSSQKDWYYLFGLGASYSFSDRNSNPIERNRKKVPYSLKGPKKAKKKKSSGSKSPESNPEN